MPGLPWFELDTDFSESPKVRALAARLREPLADAYVARLYAYCYRHARDRFDAEVAAELIEEACRWRGRRGTLVDALHAVDVLEREAGKVVVHGVKDRLGPHLSKRLGDAERQKRRRDKVAESALRHAGVTRDITRESQGNKDRDKDREATATAEACSEAPSAPPSPTVVTLPCVGAGASTYAVTRAQVEAWRVAYPGLDVEAEVRRAGAWLDANPGRRKTARGCPRFLVAWLGRAQNSPRPAAQPLDPGRLARLPTWWEQAGPERLEEFYRRRAEIAPWLDPSAPPNVTGHPGENPGAWVVEGPLLRLVETTREEVLGAKGGAA